MARTTEPFRRSTDGGPVQETLARFAETWRKADTWIESIDITAFLPPRDDPSRLQVLCGLVVIDLNMRYQRKQVVGLEFYLEKFPELGTAATVPPELIHEEYAARQRHNQSPALEEYQRRFPGQYSRLRQLAEDDSTPTLGMEKSDPIFPMTLPQPTGSTSSDTEVEQFLQQKGYRLFEKLGEGGSGEVRRAEAPGGVEVAVKIIRRRTGEHGMADREQEALELIKGLRHPFLLQTQAYWSMPDCLLIVMDLADATLSKAKNLSRDELLRVFRESAEAIDFLHDRNIQHRDIKPGNILLLKGHAKVADFGLARLQIANDQVTRAGAGTQAYKAPEVFSGMVHKHSDQYSLALSYAELRRGGKVFPDRGHNLVAFMQDRLTGTPDLSGLEEAEQKVVFRALRKSADARFPSCVAFVAALEEALRPKPTGGLRWAYWLLIGLTLMLSLIAIGRGLFPHTPTPQRPVVEPLPPGCEKADDETREINGKNYYVRIRRKLGHGPDIPFRLIPFENAVDPNTFYMMENKVSNELYQAAVNDPEFQRLLDAMTYDKWAGKRDNWKLGGMAGGKSLGIANGQLPVFRVTAIQAHYFAQWLGGSLPDRYQWDKASGNGTGASAPYREPDQPVRPPDVAFDLEATGPMPVGTAARDISPFGCRDMSGNGFEWTCTTKNSARYSPRKDQSVRILLRGNNYRKKTPLRFEDLLDEENPDSLEDYEEDMDTSFRVALPVPTRP